MANAIPLISPGQPGYVSPERMQAIYDSESHLRALFLSGRIDVDEFERRFEAWLQQERPSERSVLSGHDGPGGYLVPGDL